MRFVRKLIIFCAALLLLSGCAHTDAKERFTEASDLLGQAEYDKAIGVFEGLIADNEYTAESWRGIGIARMETGAYTEASIAFSRSKLAMTNQGPAFARDLEEYTAYCRMKTGKTAGYLGQSKKDNRGVTWYKVSFNGRTGSHAYSFS